MNLCITIGANYSNGKYDLATCVKDAEAQRVLLQNTIPIDQATESSASANFPSSAEIKAHYEKMRSEISMKTPIIPTFDHCDSK